MKLGDNYVSLDTKYFVIVFCIPVSCNRRQLWSCSVMCDSAIPWTIAYQALPSVEFSKQEYWSGLPFPSPGDLPDLGIKPRSPSLKADSLPSETPGKPHIYMTMYKIDNQFSSVAQSCLTLCDPMNCSTPGLPVHHQLPEFTQTHVHWVSDAIQPSHPLSSPSPPAPNPSQHQGLFQWINSSHEVAKVLEFQL